MKKIKIYLLFVLVLTSCVQQSSPQTSVPPITENAITVTPQPIAEPTATPIPLTETKLTKDTFLFPCDSNLSTVLPLKKDTALNILGSYGEMAVVTSYADKSEVCGLVALTSLENKPVNSVPSEYFVISESVNAISLFKDLQDDRLKIESDDKLVIDNTVASDTKEGYYLTFNNDQPVSTLNPFAVSLRFEAKDISSIMIFGKPRDWNNDWWQDVTFLEIACNKNQCDVSFYDGTSENGQSITSFENNPDLPLQILFQDPLGNELDFIFPDGKSENFKLHAPLFPDKQMEVGAQTGPNSKLEVNEYKILQVPYSHAPRVITPENATNIQLLAAWGKGIPYVRGEWFRDNPRTRFSSDYKIVLIQTVRGAYLYSLNDGKEVMNIQNAFVSDISDDGKHFATGYDDFSIKIWNTSDKSLFNEIFIDKTTLTPDTRIKSLKFSHEGKLIGAVFEDNNVMVWDVQSERNLFTWNTYNKSELIFSANDRFFIQSGGNLWKRTSEGDFIHGGSFSGAFQDFDVSPDGKYMSGIACNTLELGPNCVVTTFELGASDSLKESSKFSILKQEERYPGISYSKDGKQLIVDLESNKIRQTHDAQDGKLIESASLPDLPYPDAQWLLERGHIYYSTVGFGINPVGFTAGLEGENILPDGLVWGVADNNIFWRNISDNTVQIYSLDDQEIDFSSYGFDFIFEQPQDVVFAPDGLQAAWCKDGQVTVVSYDQLKSPKVFSPFSCDGSIAISPDHNTFAIWARNKISLVSISSGEIQNLSAHSHPVIGVAFSEDGNQMVSTAKNEVFLWELSSNKSSRINEVDLLAVQYVPNSQFPHGFGDVWCDWCVDQSTLNLMKVISPSGTLMANTSGGGEISLWKLPVEEHIFDFKAHDPVFVLANPLINVPLDITSLSFIPDGTGLISVGSDGVVKLWGIR